MNSTLVLIQTQMMVKNDYERSRSRCRSRVALAKEARFKDKNKCA